METCLDILPEHLLAALRSGQLTEAEARAICAYGQEVAALALLLFSQQLAAERAKLASESCQRPNSPSGSKPPATPPETSPATGPTEHRGSKPPYQKPSVRGRS